MDFSFQSILDSFRPFAVWGGYTLAAAGELASYAHALTTMDMLLALGIKLLTFTTLALAVAIQIRTLKK